jgi:PqqD family protein of HPr-rel-A system
MIVDRTAWKLAGDTVLLSRSWDGEHVVYHPAAGDTHLLGEAAAQVLSLLQVHPADSAELAAVLADYCSPDERAHAAALTAAILTDLQSLGLIEKILP